MTEPKQIGNDEPRTGAIALSNVRYFGGASKGQEK
jgi:hypothetical protein